MIKKFEEMKEETPQLTFYDLKSKLEYDALNFKSDMFTFQDKPISNALNLSYPSHIEEDYLQLFFDQSISYSPISAEISKGFLIKAYSGELEHSEPPTSVKSFVILPEDGQGSPVFKIKRKKDKNIEFSIWPVLYNSLSKQANHMSLFSSINFRTENQSSLEIEASVSNTSPDWNSLKAKLKSLTFQNIENFSSLF